MFQHVMKKIYTKKEKQSAIDYLSGKKKIKVLVKELGANSSTAMYSKILLIIKDMYKNDEIREKKTN